MPMDPNLKKEQFSNAFFQAVVAAAGYKTIRQSVDDDSIDWGIKGYREPNLQRIPQLEVQLKCTAQARNLTAEQFPFDLKRKNYDDLRQANAVVPRLLVVFFVPNDESQWMVQDDMGANLRYCGYWHNLRGAPTITKQSQRIFLNRTNVFNVYNLKQLMHQIGLHGGLG